MSEQPRHTKRFEGFRLDHESDVMPVLAAFIRKKGGIGMLEEDVIKESGLQRDDALLQVSKLEKEGFVRSFLCQEGTAGPYARRYKLTDGFGISLDLSKPTGA